MVSYIICEIDGKDIHRVVELNFDGDLLLTTLYEEDLPEITSGEHIFTVHFCDPKRITLLLKTPIEIVNKNGTTLRLRITDQKVKKELLRQQESMKDEV